MFILSLARVWRLCRLGEAPTPPPFAVVEPPETPFTTKKEIRRGEISKNKAKGFSGGASAGLPAQALGLSLHGSASIALEIGSRFFVDCSQIREKFREVARTGGFWVGGAQRRPSGFRG